MPEVQILPLDKVLESINTLSSLDLKSLKTIYLTFFWKMRNNKNDTPPAKPQMISRILEEAFKTHSYSQST